MPERKNKEMKTKFLTTLLGAIAICLPVLLSACETAPVQNQPPVDGVPQVTVSIPPQAFFVERIAGEAVSVNVMVQPGDNVHTYEPSPEQMKMVSSSQIFFSIGVEYEENWIPRFTDINPQMIVVDSAAGIQKIEATDHHDHEEDADSHDDEPAKHGHDPHVWLAPAHGERIAENILVALIDLVPDKAERFQENFDSLIVEIDALDARILTALANLENRQFMVYHPAWGYFAEQYQLIQFPVEIGGQEPSARELAELVKLARQENINVIFVQPAFNTANAITLANELGAEVVLIDPLEYDWLDNLNTAAEAFANALNQ
jgi:zinc transport system substrate-binding protein